MSAAARRAHWRDLVGRRLPGSARPDWPVRLDHCFARILLDNACGGPWRDRARPPAHANMPTDQLDVGDRARRGGARGKADLALLEPALAGVARQDRGRAGARPAPGRRPAPAPLAPADTASLAALNADPVVMAHFPRPRTAAESAAEARLCDRRFVADGFGPWALEHDGPVHRLRRRRCGSCGPCPSRAATGRASRSSWPGAWRAMPGAGASPPAPRGWPSPISPDAAASAPSWRTRRPAIAAPGRSWSASAWSRPGRSRIRRCRRGALRDHVLYRLDGADMEEAA